MDNSQRVRNWIKNIRIKWLGDVSMRHSWSEDLIWFVIFEKLD
jgi:hypothetical protein